MRYWLRGGIIALIILVLGYIAYLFEGNSDLPLSILLFFFGENPLNPPIVILWFIVVYFVIGAVLGWIYGLIKLKIIKR